MYAQVDLDFVPSTGLHASMVSQLPALNQIPFAALVVPHFESLDCEHPDLPTNVQDLYRSLQAGRIRPFYAETSDLLPGYPPAMKTPTSDTCFVQHPDFAVGTPAYFHACLPGHKRACLDAPVTESQPLHAAGVNLSRYQRWLNDSRQGLLGFYSIDTQFSELPRPRDPCPRSMVGPWSIGQLICAY